MRIKTLGIVLVTAMSLFTAFYWITDPARRETAYQTQLKELVAYGQEMFGPNTIGNDHTANCARCHGADGTGGPVGDTGRQAPNLHAKSIYEKLRAQNGGSFTDVRKPGDPPDYVNLVIRFGGVVVSGDVNSPMPAWSSEIGGALTVNQIDALTALVETWALEAGSKPDEVIPNTVAAGQKVFTDSGCGGCHGPGLAGVKDASGTVIFPSLLNIGNLPVTELPTPISHLDQLQADYAADPKAFLERWIRDSSVNYNDGTATGMPVHPEGKVSASAMQALITFLLSQKQ
jgi:mono/diheme cytochrome c family protein